jgi:serine/threonine protein kinase/WD40 repeat protein
MQAQHSPEKSLFCAAIELSSAEERAAFLEEACKDNPILRTEVEALLRAHESPQPILDETRPGLTAADELISERPGEVIGRYKLLEQIGEGGFGVVFMAEQQQPVRRKVALKILKPGMDTKQVVGRFETERQALAIMDHPCIAKVFDGGATPSGRPYFVMELVRGVPVTKYCDQNCLSPRQRLKLFIPICEAVQHAHQKGVIHRDLKPSNILVTMHDTTPVPKIIDFGVAKAVGQELTDKTVFTGFTHMIGTPLYMSPEQAGQSGLDVDTRSDIYSLGVLLYELLTGTTPFAKDLFKQATYEEIRRIIRDDDPPKPSTRLSDLGKSGERTASLSLPFDSEPLTGNLASVSVRRHMEPAKLTKLLRGELDWIVMKALEKDRNRRYETANGLAKDLQRYLNDENVLACPPSVSYRLRKLLHRNKGPAVAVVLMILVLIAGIIGTTWGMIRATKAESGAVIEANQKKEALKDKEAALENAQEQLFQTLVQQARAERSSDRVGQRFEALAAIRKAAKLRVTAELRTEAMAALVLPDVEVVQEWAAWPDGSLQLAFDDGYHRYVRMDREGRMVVCQINDGQEKIVARLPIQAKPPFGAVSISPDGRYAAYGEGVTSGSAAANVSIWKIDGPKSELILPVPEGTYEGALTFHRNGRHLAIGHADSTVSVYDLTTASRLQRLEVGARPVYLAFHPHDSRLAVACGQAVKVFNIDNGREVSVLRHPDLRTRVYSVAWHPDGRRLATGCNDRKIRLWDTETGKEFMPPWEAPFSTGVTVTFNHAGDRLASRSWGETTIVWDATSGQLQLIIPALSGHFSTDDRTIGFEVNGNNVQLWKLTKGRELVRLRSRHSCNQDEIGHPVIDATGRIVAASDCNRLNFFELESGRELVSVQLPHREAAWPVLYDAPSPPLSPEEKGGSELGGWITGGYGALLRWPVRRDSAQPGTLFIGPPQQLAADVTPSGCSVGASASLDGRVVAVPQSNQTLVLHRGQPERRLALKPQHDVRSCAVSPDGRWVVTCSWWWDGRSKTALIWDAKTGKQVRELLQAEHTSAKFSPDGQWLMTSDASNNRLWEVGTWRELRSFPPAGFCFSRDSLLLAMNDKFGSIGLVEITTGREVARLTGPDSMQYRPAGFTPDGTRLVSTYSGSNALYVWDLRLIREELKELHLDWEWPEFPPADASKPSDKLLNVEVQLGDLAKPKLTGQPRTRNTGDP